VHAVQKIFQLPFDCKIKTNRDTHSLTSDIEPLHYCRCAYIDRVETPLVSVVRELKLRGELDGGDYVRGEPRPVVKGNRTGTVVGEIDYSLNIHVLARASHMHEQLTWKSGRSRRKHVGSRRARAREDRNGIIILDAARGSSRAPQFVAYCNWLRKRENATRMLLRSTSQNE
jgi:hypothetical protein